MGTLGGTSAAPLRLACMRRWGIGLALSASLLTACGARPAAVNSATPTLTGTPTPSSEPAGPIAVFLEPISTSQYRISLVRVNGSVAALADAARRSAGAGTPLPFVSSAQFGEGSITPTYVCKRKLTTCQRLVDWSGAITEWTTIATVWVGALNPRATQMAGCCNFNSLAHYSARSTGGYERRLPVSAEPVAWMDDNHIIYSQYGSGNAHIFTLDIGPDVTIQAPGFPVASVPVGVQ